ncbi:MAG: helix-turn-helix domain-containing protein [Lentisphaerae bacterium]|nr:helix-turn-helix domain-containing protein [Lentisphaerota bacterium]
MALGEILRKARLAKKETASQVAAATQMQVQIVEDIEREDFRRVAAPIYGKGFIKMYARHVGLDPKPLVDEYVERFMSPGLPPSVQQPDIMDENSIIEELPSPSKKPQSAPSVQQDTLPEEADLFARAEKLRTERRRATMTKAPSAEPLIDFDKIWSKAKTIIVGYGAIVSRLMGQGTESVREKLKDISGSWPKPGFQIPKFQMPNISIADSPVKIVSISIALLILVVFLISGLSQCARKPDITTTAPDVATEKPLRIASEPPPPYFE